MLKKLELTCFRQHEALTITFTEGLNCIRAPNEGGKTTLLEALGYALFGTSALRNKMEDVVTWGHKISELRVVADFADLIFERSKGGATVTKNGEILVTGQTEVSNYAAKILGCDAKVAGNLMLAGQGSLRGILESGPTAAANLIEELGEFDLFDRILAAAEQKLPLGNSALQTDRIARLKADLEDIQIVEDPRPTWDVRRKVLDRDKAKVAEMNEAHVAARTNLDELTSQERQLEVQVAEVKGLKERSAGASRRIADLEAQRAALFPTSQLALTSTDDLHQQIAGAAEAEEMYKLYTTYVGTCAAWAEWLAEEPFNRALFEENHTKVCARVDSALLAIREHQNEIRLLEQQIVTGSACGYCGKDVSEIPEVAAKNLKLKQDIAEHQKKLDENTRIHRETLEVIAEREALIKKDAEVTRDFSTLSRVIDIDTTMIPAKYTWHGKVPDKAPASLKDLKQKLAEVEESNKGILTARAKMESVIEESKRAAQELDDAAQRLKGYPKDIDADIATLRREKQKAQELEAKLAGSLYLTRTNLQNIEQALEADIAEWTRLATRAQELRRQITDTEKEITTISFNNALVKKVRAARPIIGNKLWAMVLASVSTILGTMRGEQSIVEKGKDGFTVNGKAATSLSGSALDLLGLSIRCALIKTFIPGANFMVLDEPSASCDQGRTNAMLGYISASGFGQVLLVTHNEQSESFAQKLIQL